MNIDLLKSIEKAKQGDNLAISEIMNQYNSELFNLARMYSKTEEDAKDAVQNAYIRAFRNLSTLEDNSKFDAWIKQITVNEAKRIVMSSYNQKNTMFSDLDNEEESINYDPEDEKIENQPEMAYDKKETSEIVLSILNRLSEDQRIVALMHFYENKTLKEIAEELEIPQSTVIGRIQTAKKNIKACVLELENKEGIKLYNMAPLPFFLYLLRLLNGTYLIPTSIHDALPRNVETPKSNPEILTPKGKPELLTPTDTISKPQGPNNILRPQGEPEVLKPNVEVEIPQNVEVPNSEVPQIVEPAKPIIENEIPNTPIETPQVVPEVTQPVEPIAQPTPQRRFDPMTGKPIGEVIPEVVSATAGAASARVVPGLLTKLLRFLIPLLIVGVIGTGGYFGYKHFYKPTIKLNDYIHVNIDGYDTIGKASLEFDESALKNRLDETIPAKGDPYKKIQDEVSDYMDSERLVRKEFIEQFSNELFNAAKISPNTNLKNGDQVALTWEMKEEIQEIEELLHIHLETEEVTYTVENLEILDTFDPFEKISVELSGMNGEGSITINNTNEIGLILEVDKQSELVNGDIVTIHIDDQNIESIAKQFGKIPSPLSKEYEISGLLRYVHSVDDLSEEAYQMLLDKAKQGLTERFEAIDSYQSFEINLDSMYVLGDKSIRGNYIDFLFQANIDFRGQPTYTTNIFGNLLGYEYEGKLSSWIPVEFANIKVDENNNLVEEIGKPIYESIHKHRQEVTRVGNDNNGSKATEQTSIEGHETKEDYIEEHITKNEDKYDISSR